MRFIRGLVPALFILAAIAPAHAQVDRVASQIVIPVVASTASYVSQIVVKDQSGTARAIVIQFYEAQTSGTPGPKPCANISLAAFETKTVSLASQCTLAAGSHHGFVILTDATANRDKLFYAYTRVENPAAIGFTVEGYPIGHIGGGESYSEVDGVKRKAATPSSPAFQTNCFAATLNDPVSYSVSIDAPGSTVISDTLQPFQMRRFSDIYASAGLAAGDFENTTVTFSKDDPAQFPATLLTFCTVQDNTSFGADFRIGKNWNAADPSRFRLNCYAASYGSNPGECTNILQPSAPFITAGNKVRLLTRLYAPDVVTCSILGSRAADLKMRLVLDPGQVVVAGGAANNFTYSTGARSTIGNGYHQYYWIEVDFKVGSNATYPIPFGVKCVAGNGLMDPRWIDSPADDF
ncbi:MAG: hypothetical protein ABI533_10440 [Betaproteobacteria bacterium]